LLNNQLVYKGYEMVESAKVVSHSGQIFQDLVNCNVHENKHFGHGVTEELARQKHGKSITKEAVRISLDHCFVCRKLKKNSGDNFRAEVCGAAENIMLLAKAVGGKTYLPCQSSLPDEYGNDRFRLIDGFNTTILGEIKESIAKLKGKFGAINNTGTSLMQYKFEKKILLIVKYYQEKD